MLYMVIERFKDAPAIYKRFRENGRMMPDGLKYISSWIDRDFKTCWQLMETEDENLFEQWTDAWSDLMEFEIVPVRTSAEVCGTNARPLVVQRDTRADPGLLLIKIDAHHFALAHAHEIVHQDRLFVAVRPEKHHPDFRF